MPGRRGVPGWLGGLIGLVGLLAAWWLLSKTAFTPAAGTGYTPVPAPNDVISTLFHDGFSLYWTQFKVTISEAAWGFLWGNLAAIALAATVLVVPKSELVITQIAVVTYCLPTVAVGGIAVVILGGATQPGDPSKTAILLAALAIFFTTVVGAVLGFKSADKASLDVVHVFGGGPIKQLLKVRLVAAVPAIISALQIAVPTSLLGAVLGEYMGSTSVGVGPSMIRLQGQLDSTRVWGVFIACTVVALIGYGLVGLLGRLITGKVAAR